jgi:hypothetical protein
MKKVWIWIRKWLLRIPVVDGWLMRWELQSGLKEIHARLDPLIAKARKEKNGKLVAELDNQFYHEYVWLHDPFNEWESDQIVRKARKYLIDVPVYPSRTNGEDEVGDETWYRNSTSYEWVLTQGAAQRFRKEIRDEERAANDDRRKRVTFWLALAGFLLALSSIWSKSKQPDPCQRNYYRNDQGACVFALQPITAPTPALDIKPQASEESSLPSKSHPSTRPHAQGKASRPNPQGQPVSAPPKS